MREQSEVITNWYKYICIYSIYMQYQFPKSLPNDNESRTSKFYKSDYPYRTYANLFKKLKFHAP